MMPPAKRRNRLGYFWALHVATRRSSAAANVADGLSSEIANVCDWVLARSPLARWNSTDTGKMKGKGSLLDSIDILVLEWSSNEAEASKWLYHTARARRPDLPILVVKCDAAREPFLDALLAANDRVRRISGDDLRVQDRIQEALAALGAILPPANLALDVDENDPETVDLLHAVGKEFLAAEIQRFFPDAETVLVRPVGGGWSGTYLCRVFVPGNKEWYFLKFFNSRDDHDKEKRGHEHAQKWLTGAIVDVRDYPFPTGGTKGLAFPTISPLYPVCYRSASTQDRPRRTFKEVYATCSDDTLIDGAINRLIRILATNQPAPDPGLEPPWTRLPNGRFFLKPQARKDILTAASDLKCYGLMPPGTGLALSSQDSELLQRLSRGDLPKWLCEPTPVVYGRLHGDPNPRNCLVMPDDYNDLLLIDCGDYEPLWRLVSDLAIIERDVKLVLMATEPEASPLFDLDAHLLADWCEAEQDSLAKGLDYVPDSASSYRHCSARRAFRLVAIVRQRAKELCGDWDKTGRHYFGALLYWTLDALQYSAIRRTKKLFALFSASRIAQKF